MPDPNQITPEELGRGFDPNDGLTPEERKLVGEIEEEERGNPKLGATRLDLLDGETALLPAEMTLRLDRDLKAGEMVTVVGRVCVTMVAKMGRSVVLRIEAFGSSWPRKLPVARAARSGAHRELGPGDKVLFDLEEPVRITRDMLAGETVSARQNLLVAVASRSGKRAKLVFEEPELVRDRCASSLVWRAHALRGRGRLKRQGPKCSMSGWRASGGHLRTAW